MTAFQTTIYEQDKFLAKIHEIESECSVHIKETSIATKQYDALVQEGERMLEQKLKEGDVLTVGGVVINRLVVH